MEQPSVDVTPASAPAPVVTATEPTPERVSGQSVLDTMSPTERTAWQKSGELPERVTVTPKGEKAAKAEPTPAVGEVKTAEAPAAAAEQRAVSKRQQQINDYERRIAEQEQRIRALESGGTPAPAAREVPRSSPASATPAPSDDPEPQEADFASDTNPYAYLDARADWRARQVFRAQQQQLSEKAAHARHVDSLSKTIDTATERIASYEQAHPDFKTKVDPRLLDVVPAHLLPPGETPRLANVLAQELLSSEHVGPLLEHFSSDEGRTEWSRLVRLNRNEMLRAFGRLEARYDRAAAPQTPAPKHVSSAPTPPAVLGDRPMESVDAVEAAIKRQDPEAYFREANKRELAAIRR